MGIAESRLGRNLLEKERRMKATEFCYWLQGYFEISDAFSEAGLTNDDGSVVPPEGISPLQTEIIRRHLALVFKHDIDPKAGSPEYQAELQAIHDGSANLAGKIMRC
jgi:hypothetical protein